MNKRRFRNVVICICAFFAAVAARADTIRNVRNYRVDDNRIVVYYDLESEGPVDISLEIESRTGNGPELVTSGLTGDVGPDVRPGKQKRIVWDMTDRAGGIPEDIRLDVVARRAAPPAKSVRIRGGGPYDGRMNGGRKITAVPVSGRVKLDGVLNEPDWSEAIPATGFIQRELFEGEPSTEKTEVRILFDRDNLYVGVMCYDSEPERIIHAEMRKDGAVRHDDNFAVILDTYNDKRNGFYFRTNPNGARYDGRTQVGDDGVQEEWDSLWDVATKITDEGWVAEMMIPFKSLRFTDDPEQVWGVNFSREIARKNEETLWCAWRRDDGITQLTKAGELTGLRNIRRGRQVQLKPYALGGLEREEGDSDRTLKGGLDVRYPLTSDLTLDLTTFTDFAQVESDRDRINLTRFSLYYPEKREFFLEGAEIFEFASRYTNPFYSRRIGIDQENEQQVPILGGAKLTGKAGRYNIGVINMQTDKKGEQPSTNYSVVRVKRDVLKSSYIGMIATNLYDADDHENQAYGVDFAYNTDSFLTDKNFEVEGYVAENRTPGVNHGTHAGRFSMTFPNDLVSARFLHHTVGENYAPEVGYVRRSGIRQTSSYVSYRPRPGIPGVRQLRFTPASINYYTDMNDRLLTREFEITPLAIEFTTNDEIDFEIVQSYEYLDEDFEIFEGVTIPIDSYTWWNYSARFESNPSRPVSIELGVDWGEFFSGDREEIDIEADYNLNKHISLSTDATFNSITVGDESFDTQEYSGRINLNISPRLTSLAFVQWNNESKETVLNFRVHFIPQIGSDIYIVYNHVWDGNDNYRTIYNTGMSKIAWLITF